MAQAEAEREKLWLRRDRSRLVMDILMALSWGSMPKTKLAQRVGLNKKLFDKYVEGILVRYGLVTKKTVNRATYYMLTKKGRMYLIAMTLGDVDTLVTEEEFRERVAEALRARGYTVRSFMAPFDDVISVPVDLEVLTGSDGAARVLGRFYVAATVSASMLKYCAARCLRITVGEAVGLVAPETARPQLPGRPEVPVAFYEPGNAEHAAEAVLRLVRGSAEARGAARGARRITL